MSMPGFSGMGPMGAMPGAMGGMGAMAGMMPGMMPGMGMPGMGMPGMGMPGMGMPGMGMPGMGMPGAEGGANPFDFSGMSEEDAVKFEVVSQLYQKLMNNEATPEILTEAKKALGEEEVETIMKQYESMPEEEKKAAKEYQTMYQAMTSNFENAMKEQGVDFSDPNMNQDAFVKGMANMFTKVMNEQQSNPEFQEAINSLGENLYNKEMLYPPLKKLQDLYPKWIEDNKSKVEPAQMEKYVAQMELLKKICASFESGEKNVIGLIQMITKLTEYGTPPEEIAKQVDMPNLFPQAAQMPPTLPNPYQMPPQ